MLYRLVPFVGFLALVAAGCTVSVPDPGRNTFACHDNVDCTDGYSCDVSTQRCVVNGTNGSDLCAAKNCGNLACVYADKNHTAVTCEASGCTPGAPCGSGGTCATVKSPNATNATNVACISGLTCTPTCVNPASCQVQGASSTTFESVVDATGAASCSNGAICPACNPGEICINSASGPTCAAKCTLGTSCSGTNGWCVNVADPSGSKQAVCAICSPSCQASTGTCMVYQGAFFSTIEAANANAVCSCPIGSSGWYSLGPSTCTNLSPHPATVLNGRGPTLAFGEPGTVYLGYTDINGSATYAQVQKWWDPTYHKWTNPAGSTNPSAINNGSAQDVALAYVPVGSTAPAGLRVVWSELNATGGKRQIYLVREDPTSGWTAEGHNPLPQDSNAGNGISNDASSDFFFPSIVAVPSGNHVVVYQDANNILAVHQSGSTWKPFPAVATSNITSTSSPVVATTSDALGIYVAWQSMPAPDFIALRTLNGGQTAWDPYPANPASDSTPGVSNNAATTAASPSIALAGTNPVVAWQAKATGGASYLRVSEYLNVWRSYESSTSLYSMVFSANATGWIGPVSLAIRGDGNPILAYECSATSSIPKICISQWNGSSWVGPASGSTYDQFADINADQHNPVIAIGPSPRDPTRQAACVAWINDNSNAQPYVRCFDL